METQARATGFSLIKETMEYTTTNSEAPAEIKGAYQTQIKMFT